MSNNKIVRLYNTPLEIGLRVLVILCQAEKGLDVEKLMYLDFLCLNTSDLGGPKSLHAPVPNRGVQVFSKKELIQKGIAVILSKELIEFKLTKEGFIYSATDAGRLFLTHFQTNYYSKLVESVNWVMSKFGEYSSTEFKKFIDSNLQKWGSEFIVPNSLERL